MKIEPKYGRCVIPFGKYKGKTLDEIASTHEGLLYLDWAAGEFTGDIGEIVGKYVETIADEIDDAIEEARSKQQDREYGWKPKDWSWLKKRGEK